MQTCRFDPWVFKGQCCEIGKIRMVSSRSSCTGRSRFCLPASFYWVFRYSGQEHGAAVRADPLAQVLRLRRARPGGDAAWRLAVGGPEPSRFLSLPEKSAAEVVQGLLLAATIIVPLAGWALASTSTLGIPTLAFNLVLIPAPAARSVRAGRMFWERPTACWPTRPCCWRPATPRGGEASLPLRDDVLARMLPVLPRSRIVGGSMEINDDV